MTADWRGWAIMAGAGLLATAGLLALPAMIPRRAFWRRTSRLLAMAGAGLCLAGGVSGWVATGCPPVASAAGLLFLLAPVMALAYLTGEGLAKSRESGLPVLTAAAVLTFWGVMRPGPACDAWQIPPSADGAWLPACLVPGLIGYGFLFAAGLQAATLLIVAAFWPGRAERAGRAVYWSVCLGFPFLLWSVLGQALWGYSVHGELWDWTFREIWQLVYCLALMAYLNLHLMAGWRERRAAWFLLAASAAGLIAFGGLRSFPAPGGDVRVRETLLDPLGRARPVRESFSDPDPGPTPASGRGEGGAPPQPVVPGALSEREP